MAEPKHYLRGGILWQAVLLVTCLCAGQAQAYSVEMSEADLQLMVEQGFPIQQQMPLVTTVLSDPRLRILTGSNRLRLGLAIRAVFPNQQTARGQAEIEAGLAYDAAQGEFHLREPALVGLKIDQLPPQYYDTVKMLVTAIARQTLPIIVIYRLDASDARQAMARRVLKNVTVKDGKLIAELDW